MVHLVGRVGIGRERTCQRDRLRGHRERAVVERRVAGRPAAERIARCCRIRRQRHALAKLVGNGLRQRARTGHLVAVRVANRIGIAVVVNLQHQAAIAGNRARQHVVPVVGVIREAFERLDVGLLNRNRGVGRAFLDRLALLQDVVAFVAEVLQVVLDCIRRVALGRPLCVQHIVKIVGQRVLRADGIRRA